MVSSNRLTRAISVKSIHKIAKLRKNIGTYMSCLFYYYEYNYPKKIFERYASLLYWRLWIQHYSIKINGGTVKSFGIQGKGRQGCVMSP